MKHDVKREKKEREIDDTPPIIHHVSPQPIALVEMIQKT
jgi:hypothetical protein